MATLVNINGKILPRHQAMVNIFDRGFLFGDSVYEVLRTYRGRYLFRFEDHMLRLKQSGFKLHFKCPFSDETIFQAIQDTVLAAQNDDSYIRVIITRGESDPVLDFSAVTNPKLIVIVKPLVTPPPETYHTGIHLQSVATKRNPVAAFDPAIKSGNYLNNFLGYTEARDKGGDDALFLNQDHLVTEASTSNVFFVSDKKLKTPAIESGILHGITRQFVIAIAKETGIDVNEGLYELNDIANADEIFLSSTLKGIFPVTKFNGRAVGNGQVGPITRSLIDHFNQKVTQMIADGHLKSIRP